jgi:ABC-2 type transport system ATP-binding protein
MTVVSLESVTKQFGATVALDDVSFAIGTGAVVALLGPNGAGKSTLISLVLGLRKPDAGTIRVNGRDPRDHVVRAAIGAAPQELAFPETLRVRELVRFVASHYPASANPDELLEEFGLAGLALRQVGGLSTGQRRRLGLALAFAGRPQLVVLDEPTASLDADGRQTVWRAVAARCSAGASILVATHDLNEAEAVAGRIALIDRGRLVIWGTLSEVRARAGLTRIRYRDAAGPLVTLEVADAGAEVARLVRAGVVLDDLEVRPLTLEESLARLRGGKG